MPTLDGGLAPRSAFEFLFSVAQPRGRCRAQKLVVIYSLLPVLLASRDFDTAHSHGCTRWTTSIGLLWVGRRERLGPEGLGE